MKVQKKMYEKVMSKKTTSSFNRAKYFYDISRYYSGILSVKEFIDELYAIYNTRDKTSYNGEGTFKNLQIAALYLYYLAEVSEAEFSLESRQEKIDEIEKSVLEYIVNVPTDIPQSMVTSFLANFTSGVYAIYDHFEFLKMVLNLTVFRHKPTYVHSVMVAKISSLIMEFLAKKHPEELVGIPGIRAVEDVKANIKNLMDFSWHAGLMHDIGKISYTHMISIYVRKLNDIEFELIKQHPISLISGIYDPARSIGNEVSDIDDEIIFEDGNDRKFNFITNDQAFKLIIKAAYGHHKSYDEKSGYPKICDNTNTKIKKIIDIISIADCIDAATDSIGRSYAMGKTLDVVIGEFLDGAGTKYSPLIVNLINDNKELFDSIKDAIDDFRYDVYLSCFKASEISVDITSPPQ